MAKRKTAVKKTIKKVKTIIEDDNDDINISDLIQGEAGDELVENLDGNLEWVDVNSTPIVPEDALDIIFDMKHDTIIENENKEFKSKQEQVDEHNKNNDDLTPVLDYYVKLCKETYMNYPFVRISLDSFIIKFTYFMVSRNMKECDITPRNIARFQKLQQGYNEDSIRKELPFLDNKEINFPCL